MKRSLELESWDIISDSSDADVQIDNPTLDEVLHELQKFNSSRKVSLDDSLEISLELSQEFGISLNIEPDSLWTKRALIDPTMVRELFQLFYHGEFERLLNLEWEGEYGYQPITLQRIQTLQLNNTSNGEQGAAGNPLPAE